MFEFRSTYKISNAELVGQLPKSTANLDKIIFQLVSKINKGIQTNRAEKQLFIDL